jgi:hypothetical protein
MNEADQFDYEIPDDHHLCRYDETRDGSLRKCWVFQIRHDGRTHTRSFADSVHGSSEAAYIEAKKVRDSYIRENNIDIKERFKKSPYPGVHKTFHYIKKKDRKAWYWQVCWTENGQQLTRRFSTATIGDEAAKEKAIAFKKAVDGVIEDGGSSIFLPPPISRIKVWRYMDFTKFVYMLEKAGLFFPNVDRLGDPFEGSYSRGNIRIRKFAYSRAKDSNKLDDIVKVIKSVRQYIMVNCWHMNEHESAAMWKLYAKTNEAICIQSTYMKLRKCLPEEVLIGTVKYIDYEKQWIPEANIYYPFVYKRISFNHERELRCIVNLDKRRQSGINVENEVATRGIWLPCPLQRLIESIYIAPNSDDWFVDLVKNVIRKYSLNVEVIKSPLDTKPLK